jgi:thioester reductase-like protein
MLAGFMRDSSVTVTYFTPTQFALLVEHNIDALKKCGNYRVAYSGGERLPVRIAKAFYDLGTPATLYNAWSPCEVVVQTVLEKVEYPTEDVISIPIGRPIANCRHYIVDSRLNPLPVGFIGEICVGGAQVGVGYLGRPDANRKSFVQDPFCSEEDRARGWSRLFRTGDRGRFLPDGRLEFHGRIAGDKQVKLRGFRVDLGEVEQRLYRESSTDDGQGIVDISVVARDVGDSSSSLTDDRQLVAYIVPKLPLTNSTERSRYAVTLHKRVQKDLNAYMLPNVYQFLDRLPVTIGGKVDRQNLLTRKLEDKTYPTITETEPPVESAPIIQQANNDDILDEVTTHIKSVLNVTKEIQPSDNFFELGGQSLLILRLQSKLKRAFSVTPTVQDLMASPTPLGISQAIYALKGGAAPSNTVRSSPEIRWEDETALPSDQRFTVSPEAKRIRRSEIVNILLTGAESFMGIHILATILSTKPQTIVYVIGTHKEIQLPKLLAAMEKYKLFQNNLSRKDFITRTRCVAGGSLVEPHFGLSERAFDTLAQTVHVIYNLASEVSLLKTYLDLKAVNTTAVLSLIELAGRGNCLREIHHLSTWSVTHLQGWKTSKRTRNAITTMEERATHYSPPPTNEYGYFKSRWVAEMLLTAAAERGFPVSIYRTSTVTGSTATGVAEPQDDFIRVMIMNMVDHGMIPRVEGSGPEFVVDVMPVNYMASTVFDIASGEEIVQHQQPAIYHVGNKKPLPLKDLPALVGAIRGKDSRDVVGRIVPLAEWLKRQQAGADEQQQLRWVVMHDYFLNGHCMFALDRTNTDAALQLVGERVNCPPVDEQYLRQLWLTGQS